MSCLWSSRTFVNLRTFSRGTGPRFFFKENLRSEANWSRSSTASFQESYHQQARTTLRIIKSFSSLSQHSSPFTMSWRVEKEGHQDRPQTVSCQRPYTITQFFKAFQERKERRTKPHKSILPVLGDDNAVADVLS